jgi:hypothetical protein
MAIQRPQCVCPDYNGEELRYLAIVLGRLLPLGLIFRIVR